MKNILITGANGYIGARLTDHLSDKNIVTALCYPKPPLDIWKKKNVKIISGDIREQKTINLLDDDYDVIIHLVSLDHKQSNASVSYVSAVNVEPTWKLLEKFTKRKLSKFIYFSTINIYGKLQDQLITEKTQPSPINFYGLTHLMSENIVNYYHNTSETECINLRLSNSYGSPVFVDNNCWWLVVNDLCRNAVLNKQINLQSDGSPLRDFIHSSDLCRAIDMFINLTTDINGNIFHLSTGQTLSILELAHKVKQIYYNIFNEDIPILLPDRSKSEIIHINNKKRYQIDNSLLRDLGFIPKTTIENGITELLNYLNKGNGIN